MMAIISLVKKIAKLVFILSTIAAAFTFFKKNTLPPPEEILQATYQEPRQGATQERPFTAQRGGMEYSIKPLHTYALNGLIVTHHSSNSWMDYYHDLWKDSLNTKDLCVVWGHNIRSGVYRLMRYASGNWTCYPKWGPAMDAKVRGVYKNESLSNNHLLPASPEVAEKIHSAGTGDQIFLRGYLAQYSHSGGEFHRGSSTVRTDRGCETIWVTDFDILKRNPSPWPRAFRASFYSLAASGLAWFILFWLTPHELGKFKPKGPFSYE